jgi:tRNA(Ile)-lysidine synthetase-like protein
VKEVLSKVRGFIQRNRMFKGARRAVVAVSGGPDSVALLDILIRLSAAREPGGVKQPSRLPSTELHVAHLDHMLRGDHSAEDACFVRALAERHGLEASIGSADIKAEAAHARRGIEETARERRYAFLLEVARRIGAELILTGHTMNDQAETFLMRLARGSGLTGLAAMRPVAPAPEFPWFKDAAVPDAPRARLGRPLLCLTKQEVERYCQANRLEVRRDATNFDIAYTRNRVREQVLPALSALNPRIISTIARAAEIIASDDDALDHLARLGLEAARIQAPGQSRAYSRDSLRRHPAGLTRRILIAAIEEQRAAWNLTRSIGRASQQMTAKHVAAVESLLEGESGRRITLPGGVAVWREAGALVFRLEEDNRWFHSEIDAARPTLNVGGLELQLVRGEPADSLPAARAQARAESIKLGRDWMIALLDDLLLPDRLIVRPRRLGEKALVLGQKRIKKLKNLMIDHKIPVSRRQTWPTVVTPDDEYVWSPGLPPSIHFAAHDKTHRLAIFRALEH